MQKCVAVLMAAIVPLIAFPETFNVADAGVLAIASGDVVSPATESVPDSLPAVGSGPIFHLDASQTNGWTFGTSGTSVRKLPSLVGSRYLVSRTGYHIHDLSKRDANMCLPRRRWPMAHAGSMPESCRVNF